MNKHLINSIGILRSLRHGLFIGKYILPENVINDVILIIIKYELYSNLERINK